MEKLFKNAKESKPKKAKKVKETKEVLLLPEVALTSKITVVDKLDRGVLSEGRSTGMGFGFCKKVSENEFETVQPLSPCKDYLNDVIYSELTGNPVSACGLSCTKKGIFDGKTSYMAIKILPNKGGSEYTGFKTDVERLTKNIGNIKTLVNYVEEQLKVEGKTDIVQSSNDKDMYLLYVPYWWCRTTQLISLYSLIVRVGQYWNGEGTPLGFMESYNINLDKSLWKPDYGRGGLTQYKRMLKYGIHLITPEEYVEANGSNGVTNPGCIHSCGILTY